MNAVRRQRLLLLIALLSALALAATFVLFALRENINLFYAPAQVVAGEAPTQQVFRIGGLVVPGSVKRSATHLAATFALTDNAATVSVSYSGILPDLFREGQGIVALGKLNEAGVFVATQVLAKHDENYMPPEVKASLRAKNISTKQLPTSNTHNASLTPKPRSPSQ